jgi:hypothetical protein
MRTARDIRHSLDFLARLRAPEELETMMQIVEAFLHRAFVLGDGIKQLKAAVPKA